MTLPFTLTFAEEYPPAKEYSSFSLSYGTALFSFQALNASKFSISFGRVKRQTKVWWLLK